MGAEREQVTGATMFAEMKEFAGFSQAAQRYIRRSLDIGLGRRDALRRWARNVAEAASIREQARIYRRLDSIRAAVPDTVEVDAMEALMGPLVVVSGFDLGEGRLPGFASYRFLYERLVGPEVRPFLPAAFCAAAALPHIHPDSRRSLLQSISVEAATAAGWSSRRPAFFPEWVEKVDLVSPGTAQGAPESGEPA